MSNRRHLRLLLALLSVSGLLVFIISSPAAAVPANETFAGALTITLPYTGNISGLQTSTFAAEAGEPVHGCRNYGAATGTHSLWFRFTTLENGVIFANTDGSHFTPGSNSLLSVYTGDTLETLTEIGCNDDLSNQNQYALLDQFLPAGTYIMKVSDWSMLNPLQFGSSLHLSIGFTPATGPSPTPTPSMTPTFTLTPSATLTSAPPTATYTATISPTPPPLELLDNGDFEVDQDSDLIPDGWNGSLSGRDKRICNQPPKKPVAYSGECAFQFKGGIGENSRLAQAPSALLLAPNDLLTLSVAVKAKLDSIAAVQTTAALVKLTYLEADAGEKHNGKDKLTIKLLTSTGGYVIMTDSVTISGTPESLVVRLRFKSESGKLRLDAASLTRARLNLAGLTLPHP